MRTAITDIETHNGYTIRKGDEVLVAAYAMGRQPWIWDAPMQFRPERFMGKQPDPSKYPAFNISPRLCLGKHVALMEGKIAVIKLLCKYKRIEAVEGQNVARQPSMTLQMKNGFKVRLVKK